jgi:hypothetical protein
MNMKTAERGQLCFITRIDFFYIEYAWNIELHQYMSFPIHFELIKIFMISRNSIFTQQKQTEIIIFIFIIET